MASYGLPDIVGEYLGRGSARTGIGAPRAVAPVDDGLPDIVGQYASGAAQSAPEQPGMLRQAWETFTSPIPAIQRATQRLSAGLGTQNAGSATSAGDPGAPFFEGGPDILPRSVRAGLRGALAGALEEGVPSITTPLDLATAPVGFAKARHILKGAGAVGRGVLGASRAAELAGAAGLGIEGSRDLYTGVKEGDPAQIAQAAMRLAGAGLLGRGGERLDADIDRIRARKAKAPEVAPAAEAPPVSETYADLLPGNEPLEPADQPLMDVWPGEVPESVRRAESARDNENSILAALERRLEANRARAEAEAVASPEVIPESRFIGEEPAPIPESRFFPEVGRPKAQRPAGRPFFDEPESPFYLEDEAPPPPDAAVRTATRQASPTFFPDEAGAEFFPEVPGRVRREKLSARDPRTQDDPFVVSERATEPPRRPPTDEPPPAAPAAPAPQSPPSAPAAPAVPMAAKDFDVRGIATDIDKQYQGRFDLPTIEREVAARGGDKVQARKVYDELDKREGAREFLTKYEFDEPPADLKTRAPDSGPGVKVKQWTELVDEGSNIPRIVTWFEDKSGNVRLAGGVSRLHGESHYFAHGRSAGLYDDATTMKPAYALMDRLGWKEPTKGTTSTAYDARFSSLDRRGLSEYRSAHERAGAGLGTPARGLAGEAGDAPAGQQGRVPAQGEGVPRDGGADTGVQAQEPARALELDRQPPPRDEAGDATPERQAELAEIDGYLRGPVLEELSKGGYAERPSVTMTPEELAEADKYATKPSPGQRGLFGAEDDVAAKEQKAKAPEQRSMFGGEMLQGTEAKVPEGREADGPLFQQEAKAQERADAARQTTLTPDVVQVRGKVSRLRSLVEQAGVSTSAQRARHGFPERIRQLREEIAADLAGLPPAERDRLQALMPAQRILDQESAASRFAAGEKASTPKPISRESVQRAFASGKIEDAGEGAWRVSLPGDRTVDVRISPDGLEYNATAFQKGYGRELGEAEQIVGSWRKLDRGGIVTLAKEADDATLLHESFHGAMDLALTPREKAQVLKHYGSEEAAADAYAKWTPSGPGNSWFSKILAFFKRLYHSFRPSWESAFERTRSGEAYNTAGERGHVVGSDAQGAFATAAMKGQREPVVKLKPFERPEDDSAGGAWLKARQEAAEIVKGVDPQRPTTPEFKRFFGMSKVVDERGEPLPVYRGDNRADRVGTKFKRGKTTSGRFYFTDDPEVASGYALSKSDPHAQEALASTENWFQFPPDKGARTPNNLRSQWWRLTPEQKARVKDVLLKAGMEDGPGRPFDFSGENALTSPGHWEDVVRREAGGNWLKAADEIWLQSGSIFGEEHRFGEILKEAGLGDFKFDSPSTEHPGVFPVYLSIKRPLDTGAIPPEVVESLGRVAKSDRTRAKAYGADQWDKTTITAREWFQRFKEDQANGTTHAWTQIPEKVTTTLQAMGYDGIKDTGGKLGGQEHSVWIAFEPEQIKSAIANRGTYDPTSADIRFATAPKPKPGQPPPPTGGQQPAQQQPSGFTLPDETRVESLVRHIQDKFLRPKRVIEEVQKQGGRLRPEADFYRAEEAYHGRTEHRMKEAERRFTEPLVQSLSRDGLKLEQLDQYMMAKHAPQRNAVIAQRTNGSVLDGSGMSDAEAAQILAGFQQQGLTAKLDRSAQIVRDALKEQRNVLLRGELITPQQLQGWEQSMGPDYVPLRTAEVNEGLGSGQGFDIRGKESQAATGRKSKADSPVSFAMAQLQRAIVRAEKNKVGQSFLKFVEDNPDKGLWEIDKSHTKSTLDAQGQVTQTPDPFAAQDDFSVKVGGETKRVTIHDPLLARAMKNLGAEQMGRVMQILGNVNRGYTALVTSYSPEFLFTNPLRDIQQALGNVGAEHGKKIAGSVAKNIAPAMRGMYESLRNPNASGPWAARAREFKEHGGAVGFFGLKDVPALERELAGKVEAAGPGALQAGKRAFSSMARWVGDANKAVENGTRLAAYAALRDAGATPEKAASVAKNLTLNFNRKGELGPAFNALYAFFNANIQGTARMAQVLKTPGGQKVAGSVLGLGAMMDLYNRSVAKDQDNDGINDYQAIPEHVKERNFVIMRDDGKPLTIPMPYGYNVLHAAGRQLAGVLSGDVKPLTAAAAVASSAANAFNPLGSQDLFSLQTVAPTVLDPAVQIATNENFSGQPLMPTRRPWESGKPESELFFKTVSPTSLALARKLNELSGGDKVTSGWIDVSPEVIDHLAGFVTGGLGRFAGQAVSIGEKVAKGEDVSVREVPVARRLLYEPHPSEQRQRYMKNLEELETLDKRYKTYAEARDRKKIAALPTKLVRLKPAIDAIDKQVQSLRRAESANPNARRRMEELQKKANRLVANARRESGLEVGP